MTIEELYAAFYYELLFWCSAMCGDEMLAEDFVQEGFARAVINSKTLMPLHNNQQRAWLYRTIKNIYLNHIRHSAFELIAEDIPETADVVDEYEKSDVEQFLTILPDIERTLFDMRYFKGYNSIELSQIFNMPAGTVRSKLYSARKKLKNIIREEREKL